MIGCWEAATDIDCDVEQCFSYSKPVKALNNTKFCCCSGHLCNANLSAANHQIDSLSETFYIDSSNSKNSLNLRSDESEEEEKGSYSGLLIVCIAALVCVTVFLLGFMVCCRTLTSSVIDVNSIHKNTDSLHLLESNSSTSQSSSISCEFDKLKIIEEIGRGRYGSVWKSSLNEQTVAVKKFGQQNRQYFLNEKDIYMLPLMDSNRCLPRLFGFQEMMTSDGRPEYSLVLSYAPLGCLQDFLRNNTIDWLTLCRMIQTTTQGLAFLHSEVKRADKCKPCVAHRDLSSRNILVNADYTCMVCDFQFAIRVSGSEYYSCGERYDSQTAALNDVGTLRYMAPEILEGAVNLRDCESAMKQIDVYALGLVLWETASRCTDLYQGIEVPAYKQPFEHEIGLHPTFEQMQVLVTRHKARPLFPDIWKDSNPAIRSLKETIEDCWDPDAEARLTALCVEERFLELPILWERYKSGTLTNCVGAIYSMTSQSPNITNINNQKNAFRIGTGSNSYHNLIAGIDSNDKITNELQTNRLINRIEYTNNNFINSNNNSINLNDSLRENLVSFSPSSDFEKNIVSAANAFVNQPKVTLPLQPHQGRNPCLERNLMIESSDDKPLVLLEQGLKFQIKDSNRDSNLAEIFNDSTNTESNSLMTNDVLNRTANDGIRNVSRRAANGVTPIPFLQNAVGSATVPKQPNVAGNGQSTQIKNTNEMVSADNKSQSNLRKLLKWSDMKTLRGWPHFTRFRLKKSNNEPSLEESQPFTRNNGNIRGQPFVDREDTQNIRPVSNNLISNSLRGQTSLDPDISSSMATNPKVTQTDSDNGSPLIINKNDKISNHLNALIKQSISGNVPTERPSNVNLLNVSNEPNASPMTQSCDCLQTNLKESSLLSSLLCDSS